MPFARCQDLPYFHAGRGSQRLLALLEAARTRVVKGFVIGTSMWTCPGGNGQVSFPTFCHAFNRIYGGTPATPFQGHGSYGAVNPPGQFLLRGAYSATQGTASDLAASFYPPGVDPTKTDMLSEATIPGPMHMLHHDNVCVHPQASCSGMTCFNPDSGQVVVECLVEGFPGSATGARFRHLTSNLISAGYFAGHNSRAIHPITDLSLDTTATGGGRLYKVLRSPALGGRFGDRYLEATTLGPNASGARLRSLMQSFRDLSFNAGFSLDTFSFGGARLANWYDSAEGTYYGNCGPVLRALAPEVIFVYMGANEALAMNSDQWYTSLGLFVQWWRENVDSTTLIVVCPDPLRLDTDGTQTDNCDRFVGAAYAMADSDPLVTAFNGRRRMYDQGIASDVSMSGLTDRGAWSAATTYVANDFVNLASRGFMADAGSTGVLPTSVAGNGTWRPWRSWYEPAGLDSVHLSPWGQRQQADIYAELIFNSLGFRVGDIGSVRPSAIPSRIEFNATRRLFVVNSGSSRAIVHIPSSETPAFPLEAGQAVTIAHPRGNVLSGYADIRCPGSPSSIKLISDTTVSG